MSAKARLADDIARYVAQHRDYEKMDKAAVAREAVLVLLNNIGAAQEFLDALNVPYDLYDGVPK